LLLVKGFLKRLASFARPSSAGPASSSPPSEIKIPPLLSDTLHPVLRDYDPNELVTQIAVHRNLGAGIGIFLAHLGRNAKGGYGIDYVLTRHHDWSVESQDTAFERAWRNLRLGMEVGTIEEPGEPKFFAVEHFAALGSSAVGLPDFYPWASKLLGVDNVFVGIPEPGCLFILRPDTSASRRMQEAVLESKYWGAVALTPSCYLLSAAGLQRIAARNAPEPPQTPEIRTWIVTEPQRESESP
jgi:hypothetical protein